jgi:hypothetical protein
MGEGLQQRADRTERKGHDVETIATLRGHATAALQRADELLAQGKRG